MDTSACLAGCKKAEDDLELSCDEIVLKDADKEKRKRYAELLLSIAGIREDIQPVCLLLQKRCAIV